MLHPINLLNNWIEEEKALGAQYAQHAVISTQGIDGKPHARVVAIRKITEKEILFFTQQRTRKVEEIKCNSSIAVTFWFERHAREVILEGKASFLSEEQNERYWNNYPQWAQIRFCSYAPTSGACITDKQVLENKKLQLEQFYQDNPLPFSSEYCGISIKPNRFVFYTYRLDELSDVWEYYMEKEKFKRRSLSP